MGKRCQICDGPVVNGRCKYCGMPYRNDLELYHLNEDRSEHYRHASANAKKAMAESEIPLPDRKKASRKTAKTMTAGKKKTGTGAQTVRSQTARAQTARTYSTGQKKVQKEKKKTGKAGKIFWIIVMILMVVAGQTVEHWDTIGYQIEDFINETFDIDLGSIFDSNSTDEADENDWKDDWAETIGAAKQKQEKEPDWYMFTGENYIVGKDDIVAEGGDIDTDDLEYDFTIEPGEYRIVSGWDAVTLEIQNSSGEDETVKFDEAGHQEKIELHTGDEVSVVSLDGQDNYLAMYQIQQYDE